MSQAVATLESALDDAYKARADLYVAYFRSVEKRFGRDLAIEVSREAIRNWGSSLGVGMCGCRIADLNDAFLTQPDGGKRFQPRIDRLDENAMDVQFELCPLKERWLESGLSDEEVALFCDLAAEADYGTMQAAGLDVAIETWTAGKDGCCMLRIRAS